MTRLAGSRFLLRRALHAVLVMLLVATATFMLLHLAPGDPVQAALNRPNVSAEARELWRKRYGLDQPVSVQYVRYLQLVATGDLGWSFSQERSVGAVLADAVPNTIALMSVAIAASLIAGVVLGVAQARRAGSAIDSTIGAIALTLYATPEVWLALAMLFLFAYELPLFPISGVCDPLTCGDATGWALVAERLRHLALPAMTLALLSAAAFARFQRVAMIEALQQDFVRTARAKGASESRIAWHHAFRNSLLPTISLVGLTIPALVGGAFFIEQVFAWPGMGYVTMKAIEGRDYPLATASIVLGSALALLGSLAADIGYVFADPRLRRERE